MTGSRGAVVWYLMLSALLLLQMLLSKAAAQAIKEAVSTEMDLSAIKTRLGKKLHALELVEVYSESNSDAKKTRILCWVNTYHKNHDSRIPAIKRTWGRKCDKILFMSDVEDPVHKTVRIQSPPLHKLLWQKHREVVRMILREIDENDFDWIYKCDDDTFVIMENLRRYLTSEEVESISSSTPLLLGHRMTLQWWELERPFDPIDEYNIEHVKAMLQVRKATAAQGGLYYTPGGAGYAMNWAFVKTIAASFEQPHCLPHEIVPDDWAISFCMYKHNVYPRDTRDHLQRERFHQYDPALLFYRAHDENAYDHRTRKSIYEESNWFSDHYGIGWKNGSNCCAPDTISFHYITPPFMDILHSYFYAQSD